MYISHHIPYHFSDTSDRVACVISGSESFPASPSTQKCPFRLSFGSANGASSPLSPLRANSMPQPMDQHHALFHVNDGSDGTDSRARRDRGMHQTQGIDRPAPQSRLCTGNGIDSHEKPVASTRHPVLHNNNDYIGIRLISYPFLRKHCVCR